CRNRVGQGSLAPTRFRRTGHRAPTRRRTASDVAAASMRGIDRRGTADGVRKCSAVVDAVGGLPGACGVAAGPAWRPVAGRPRLRAAGGPLAAAVVLAGGPGPA